VLIVLGGIIPDADLPGLAALGITGVFRPGTPMTEIADFIAAHARSRARIE
jgi:methylmalonyl-CoA mutase C-terminal domain/subunit